MVSRNVAVSFADAIIARIWNIVYDRRRLECVKLKNSKTTQTKQFLTMISAFYGDFEEKQAKTLIKSICFVNSP